MRYISRYKEELCEKIAIAFFTTFLFGGILYLFMHPTTPEGWLTLVLCLIINPGLMLALLFSAW